jgi:hypothetical protein
VRARLAWLLGGAGLAGAFYALTRRRPQPAAPVDSRAEELREKLAESRAVVAEPEEERPVDVEDKRRAVHERGREAAEQMRKSRPAE